MAKQKISELAPAATLTGAEVVIVNQSGVTKRSTVTDVQAIPLAAATAAQTTANAKLATVAVDGTTITGDGTFGNPLAANVGSAYDVYTIVATTTGGAQVFTINATLQNTIGTIVWTYDSTGYWIGTLTGLCTGDNTVGYMLNNANSLVSFFKIDNNSIGLNATDFAFAQINNAFFGAVIEIRKYN